MQASSLLSTKGISLDSRTLGYAALSVTLAFSGFVYVEPSPFDLGIIALAGLYLLGGLVIPVTIVPMIVMLSGFILGGYIAAPFTEFFRDTIHHMNITTYLSVAAIFIACIVSRESDRAFRAIFNGYMVAAVVAAIAGIIGYLAINDATFELFTKYGRARGTFKDPNVFAPFLIAPALFCLYRMFTSPALKTIPYLSVFACLSLAILLSLSRGAIGHLLASSLLMIIILLIVAPSPRFRGRLILWSVIIAITAPLAIAVALNIEGLSDAFANRFQLIQPYDSGGFGRFDGHHLALDYVLSAPLGIGFRAFATVWGADVHNVYLNVFLVSGWLGGFSYLALVITTCFRALQIAFIRGPMQYAGVILAATFLPLALLGMIIDTDHWRHFFVLLGLIWGISVSSGQTEPSQPIRAQEPSGPTSG